MELKLNSNNYKKWIHKNSVNIKNFKLIKKNSKEFKINQIIEKNIEQANEIKLMSNSLNWFFECVEC